MNILDNPMCFLRKPEEWKEISEKTQTHPGNANHPVSAQLGFEPATILP